MRELAHLWNRLNKMVNCHNCQQATTPVNNQTPTPTPPPANTAANNLDTHSLEDNDISSIQSDSTVTFNDDFPLKPPLDRWIFETVKFKYIPNL